MCITCCGAVYNLCLVLLLYMLFEELLIIIIIMILIIQINAHYNLHPYFNINAPDNKRFMAKELS